MSAVHQANTEPLPGYRLLEPLGQGGFGEVWKCEAPGGLVKAIKFVAGQSQNLGDDNNGAAQELRALQHIKTIRHPFLLSMDRVEIVKGDLLIVMELADRTLQDLLEEYRSKGQPGIPRDELLRYFQETAEVLDLMNQEHHLQHLDIKPRNLFLVGRHIKLADFGLVNSLADCNGDKPSERHLGAITPTYASPDSFAGTISSSSDQYSLAVSYHELLTGSVPFDGKSFRQLAMQHMQAVPNLGALPDSDQPVVARALAKDPKERFPTCGAFVQALTAASTNSGQTSVPAQVFDGLDNSNRPRDASPSTTTLPTVTRSVTPAQTSSPLEFAGLQLQECVSRQCGGELWHAATKDGRKRLVRFLIAAGAGAGDHDPVARLAQFKHVGLAKMEIVRDGPNRIALVIEAGADHCGGRLKECLQAGLPGIPRGELLDRLATVAAALDDLYEEHQVPHLTLSPRKVALVGGKARLLDFGLAALFWLPAGEQPGALNPRYAAPELFDGALSPHADQYSLALLFHELLTGVHPYRHLNARQLANPRQRGAPDLSKVANSDRTLLLRALDNDPARRYPSCSDFIEQLSDVLQAPKTQSRTSSVRVATVGSTTTSVTPVKGSPLVPGTPTVTELVALAAKGQNIHDKGDIRYLLKPGLLIRHQCSARLVAGMVSLKLYPFRDRWRALLKERKAEEQFLFHVSLPMSLWQSVTGRRPSLAVELRCTLPPNESTALAEIDVDIWPVSCGAAQAVDILKTVGPLLLESLWGCLNATPERRGSLRLPFDHPVQLALGGRAR